MNDILWYFATILHLFLCLILVVVVLLQQGKGSDIGAAFGGGSTQTMFGSRGPASFFHYVTTGAAVLFMVTSLYLAMFPQRPSAKSAFESGTLTPTPTATASPAEGMGGDEGADSDEDATPDDEAGDEDTAPGDEAGAEDDSSDDADGATAPDDGADATE